MPLFHRESTASSSDASRKSVEDPNQASSSHGGHKLFGRRSEHSPTPSTATNGSAASRHSSNLLHRRREDPSIAAAREQVIKAETAERELDKALMAARNEVREAKERVKQLEREAAEEARLAKIKQDQAASISKRAKPLGSRFP